MDARVPEQIDQLVAYKGAAIAVWLAMFLALERLWPAASRPSAPLSDPSGRALAHFAAKHDLKRIAKNGALWAFNALLGPAIVLPVTLLAVEWGPAWRPPGWSGWPALLLDLALLDLWIYWWHRANHESSWLWRFHRIHHLDNFLDASSAGRFHAGEVALSAMVRGAIILALDIPLGHVLAFEALVLAAAIFQHSNLALPVGVERALSRLVVTPSIHWLHHHAVRADTDSNYSTTLSLWDRVFGTQSPNVRSPAMAIGLAGEPDTGLGELLAAPLRRARPVG